jgi:hypothetical protein
MNWPTSLPTISFTAQPKPAKWAATGSKLITSLVLPLIRKPFVIHKYRQMIQLVVRGDRRRFPVGASASSPSPVMTNTRESDPSCRFPRAMPQQGSARGPENPCGFDAGTYAYPDGPEPCT